MVFAVVPADAVSLVGDSLDRVVENQSGSIVMIVVGLCSRWDCHRRLTRFMRA